LFNTCGKNNQTQKQPAGRLVKEFSTLNVN